MATQEVLRLEQYVCLKPTFWIYRVIQIQFLMKIFTPSMVHLSILISTKKSKVNYQFFSVSITYMFIFAESVYVSMCLHIFILQVYVSALPDYQRNHNSVTCTIWIYSKVMILKICVCHFIYWFYKFVFQIFCTWITKREELCCILPDTYLQKP